MKEGTMLVDIVIITWNCLEYLKLCISSIEKYTDVPYTIIVVNNGSSDGTKEYLDSLNRGIKIINNKINIGYPKALRQGFKKTSSELVCVMNDDIIVSPGWLDSMSDLMEKHPKVGILGPSRPGAYFLHPYTGLLSKAKLEESKSLYNSPKEQLEYFIFNKNYESFVSDFKQKNPPELKVLKAIPDFVSTCCALIRRSSVDESGGIVDTKFTKYGGDDIDLSWRLFKNGFSAAITNKAYVHHFEHVSMQKGKVDRQKYLKINSIKLYEKWKGDITRFLSKKLNNGLSKEDILDNSWLLKRIADAVGPEFWGTTLETKPH